MQIITSCSYEMFAQLFYKDVYNYNIKININAQQKIRKRAITKI